MPEGDTYVRAAARARPVLVGRTVEAVDGVPALRRHSGRVLGHVVTGVRTIGKHLLFDLSSGWTIHAWLGMPGRVHVTTDVNRVVVGDRRAGERGSPDAGAVRLRLVTEVGVLTVLSAPTVEIERRRVLDAQLSALGPDVLVAPFDWEQYTARAELVAPGRPVADTLLDQRVLAGVGNEYKSEILFLEGLHPLQPFDELSPAAVRGLATRAIALMGANVGRSRRVTTGHPAPGQETWVYGRQGRPCRRCRSGIRSAHLGSPPRLTFWCPRCQAPPGSGEYDP